MKRWLPLVLAVLPLLAACDPPVTRGPAPSAVALVLPADPLYVGSYVRVPVRISSAAGVGFDDLVFRVVEGPPGGTVSESRDTTFDPARPDVMLIAGHRPGTYTLEAAERSTGTVRAAGTFRVDVRSRGGTRGPSFVTQTASSATPSAGTAWGGGPAGRQNVGTNPTGPVQRIALIFVDTDDQRFPTDAATMDALRATWRQHLVDGVTAGGFTRSVRHYYEEASLGGTTVQVDVFGPYALDGSWTEVGPGAGWFEHAQAVVTAADPDVDFSQYNTVMSVSQGVGAPGSAGTRFAWPIASIGRGAWWVTADPGVVMGSIQMPHDWMARDTRTIFQTASHELGHNLGLGDQYTPAVPGRNPGDWELMHAEGRLPGFSLAHKMRLGWVQESWVRGFDFASLGSPVDQTVTLVPTAAGAPAPGRFVGAEVRITDGLNYYFEYRRLDSARIADRGLPTDDRVLLTDVRSGDFTPPIARPDILLMHDDADGDGPVLGNGQDFRQMDTSSPTFPVEFRADVSAIDGTRADVRIRYGINERPDPSIRPWGAPPWQTPDIEVRNARNATDPLWFNVPWVGNPNDVIATIRNNSVVAAPGVRVEFYVKNYNVGGAPETFLGADTRDMAPGETVEFSTSWVPPSTGHYCIVVRIPLYVRPGTPVIVELTELNNVAQSNYDRFISGTASPAERRITQVEVGNPFDRPTRVFVTVDQSSPFYRTYLEHKWLDLGPLESRPVTVMMEYVGTAPPGAGDRQRPDDKRPVNQVMLAGYAQNPYDTTGHNLVRLGGAQLEVATGERTRFQEFGADARTVHGAVVTAGGQPVSGGAVILTLRDPGGRLRNQRVELRSGIFRAQLQGEAREVTAYYVPAPGYADATSETLRID